MSANPHCPVNGCRATKPHADDPIVKGVIAEFAPPDKMTIWVHVAMAELRESICKDLSENRIFAWHTRLRQPEELYIRTLYALFIATERELHHILSGEMPNGLSQLYERVNKVIFQDKGPLKKTLPGLNEGTFKPIDTLNDGAHTSFRAFTTCIGLARNRQYLPSPEKYREHLSRYCAYLEYMHGMFKAGKDKEDILVAVRKLHGSASNRTIQR
jgi:hypothetical protein